MFYRLNTGGAAAIFEDSGETADRITDNCDARRIYPLGSPLSCCHEHPEGIVLTVQDAERLGITSED